MSKDVILKALKEATGEKIINLEFPENEGFGDYSTNIAMAMVSKTQKLQKAKTPRELAQEIVEKLKEDKELVKVVEKIEVAGPGFINFWLRKDVLLSNLEEISKKKQKYGSSVDGKGKTVIVEYSSPNIAKPFTIGHLRSTIIGDTIANLLEATGWKVLRDNHLGDWGTQFGKQIYAIKTWGDEDTITKSDNPVKELVDLYVRFHEEAEKDTSLEDKAREWFKKLEDGDSEARRIWKMCVDLSWVAFDKIYSKLGVKFSKEFENGRGLGESFFEERMKAVTSELEEKGLLKVGEEGAKLVFFPKDKYPPAMILKKDGTTLYHTRDLATDKYRKEKYNPDLIVNEVGVEQTLYFQQLFEMEKMLGWYEEGQRVHVGHGLYRFKDRKMSTRKGNIIWLEEVLAEAVSRAKNLGESRGKDVKGITEMVGIGAIKWNDLKREPKTEVVFDWDDVLNMEGNSGPYLQYTVARTNSVLAKVKMQKSKLKTDNLKMDQFNNEELAVLRSLTQFSEVIKAAAKNYAPNLLCNYLFDLAQKYNNFYNVHRILEPEVTSNKPQVTSFRLALTAATGQVLKNGLKLLGIDSPERM